MVGKVARHIVLALILAAMLLPVVIMISTSLKTFDHLWTWPPQLIPKEFAWENYLNVWGGNYEFSRPFLNSVIIASATSLISVLLGSLAGYAAARFKFWGRQWFLFAVLATQMVSPVVFIVPLYKAMRTYGLLNSLTSVVVATTAFALPMIIWLMQGYFQSLPDELEEAAMVDGCSRFTAWIKVILPLSAPGLTAAGIYAFILGWDQLMFPLTFLTRSELKPVTLALYDFSGFNIVYWHEMMAASTIAVIPAAIAFALVQKFLVGGLTAGSVKG